jgi:aspartate-semialdehyde dehydrogenase
MYLFKYRGSTLSVLVVGLVVAFAALQKLGSIDQASVVSLQAISGAGYPGVPSESMYRSCCGKGRILIRLRSGYH